MKLKWYNDTTQKRRMNIELINSDRKAKKPEVGKWLRDVSVNAL